MSEFNNQSGSILLISCYELGHQPAGISLPAGFLRREGYDAETMDVSVEGFDREKVKRARLIGVSVPMHTALRLGLRVAQEIRRLNPQCHICFYGLYASLNANYLLGEVADSIIGGEFEEALVELIKAIDAGKDISVKGVKTKAGAELPVLARLNFAAPDRSRLRSLEHYARLEYKGQQRLVGYTEASRGCLHTCTHCPIPPVYEGRFFAVDREVVLEDIRRLVEMGARHITFGDPDFLNGPTHSLRIARLLHEEFSDLTFDFTAKIEHLLKHRSLISEFAALGCIFIVSAVESLSDAVLKHLEKGHTRRDVEDALKTVSDAGIALRPSFVAFTPWTTIDDYIEVLEFVEEHELIAHVDAVQYSIRLLIPPGSILLARSATKAWLGRLNQEAFSYEWKHPDPRMDEMHSEVSAIVEEAARRNEDAAITFYRVLDVAYRIRGEGKPTRDAVELLPLGFRPPRLTEAWFC